MTDFDYAVRRIDAHVRSDASCLLRRVVDDRIEKWIVEHGYFGEPLSVAFEIVKRSVKQIRPTRRVDIRGVKIRRMPLNIDAFEAAEPPDHRRARRPRTRCPVS